MLHSKFTKDTICSNFKKWDKSVLVWDLALPQFSRWDLAWAWIKYIILNRINGIGIPIPEEKNVLGLYGGRGEPNLFIKMFSHTLHQPTWNLNFSFLASLVLVTMSEISEVPTSDELSERRSENLSPNFEPKKEWRPHNPLSEPLSQNKLQPETQ